MEMETTASPEVVAAASVSGVVGLDAEGFGIRPRTDRPHSMKLFGDGDSRGDAGARGLDLLLGVGIGAALMYYLDPEAGARRRAAARERIVETVASVLPARGSARTR